MTDLNKLRSEFESIKEIQDSIRREQLIFNTKLGCYTKKSGKMCVSANWTNGAWFVFERKAKDQAVPEWISVKDGLPSYEDSVLIKTNKGTVQGYLFQDEEYSEMKGEYLKYDGWQDEFHDDFIEYEDVTHWMPLPKAPSESGAEG